MKLYPKVRFKNRHCLSICDLLKDCDVHNLLEFVKQFPEGESMEALFRPVPNYDKEQMRKYLHGPVIKFLISQFEEQTGKVYTKEQIKQWIKEKYVGNDRIFINDKLVSLPKSTEDLTREEYCTLIKAINHDCVEMFGWPLPPTEEYE